MLEESKQQNQENFTPQFHGTKDHLPQTPEPSM